jgi:UDP-N-acetyl-D-mannosaminuronate dehydrogenase
VVDPYVNEFSWHSSKKTTVKLNNQLIKKADAVIITTGHKNNVDYKLVCDNADIVFDTKNILKKLNLEGENIILL